MSQPIVTLATPSNANDDIETLLSQSERALQAGQIGKALKTAQGALTAGGGARAHLALAKIYFSTERWAEALAQFDEVLKLDSSNSLAQRGRGKARAELLRK